MRRTALWVLAATMSPMLQAMAQAPVGVSQLDQLFRSGQRVRIVIDAPVVQTRIVGYVTRHALDTVVVDTSETWRSRVWFNPRPPIADEYRSVALDISQVDSVEVSRGRSHLMGALLIGWKVMAIGAAAMGAASMQGQGAPRPFRVLQGVGEGAVIGGLVGIPFGWMRGTERWRRVPIGEMVARAHGMPSPTTAIAARDH